MKTFEVTLSERRSVTQTIQAKNMEDAEQQMIDEHATGGLDFDYYDNLECNTKECVEMRTMTTYNELVESFLNHKPNVMSRQLMVNLIEKIGGEKKFLETYEYVSTDYHFKGIEGICEEQDVVDILNENFNDIKTTFDNMAAIQDVGTGIEYILSDKSLAQDFGLTPTQITDSFYAPLDSSEQSTSERISLCFWITNELYYALCSGFSKHTLKSKASTYSDSIQAFILASDMSDSLAIATIEQFGGEEIFLEVYKEVIADGIQVGYGNWFGRQHIDIFFKTHKSDIIDFINDEAKKMGLDSHLDLISHISSTKDIEIIKEALTDGYQNKPSNNKTYFSIISAMTSFVAEEATRNYATLSGEEF